MRAEMVWRYRLKDPRRVTARSPMLGESGVHVVFNYGQNSVLACCDAASGSLRWEVPVGFCGNTPALGPGGRAYVTNFEGAVYAIGPDGGRLWRTTVTDHNTWAPLLVDAEHLVFAETGGLAGRTWCLDPNSGEVRWRFDSGGPSFELAGAEGRILQSTVRPDDDGTRLYCLSVDTGEPLWVTDGMGWLFTPRIVHDVVFIGARRSVHAYDLDTGALLGRLGLRGRSREAADVHGIVAASGRLYFGDTLGGSTPPR